MNDTLKSIAEQIRDTQLKHGWSDGELCRRYAGLGSTKTFKRILAGDLEELDPERWQIEYEQVWTLVQLEANSTDADEPVYEDLKHITAARLAVTDAMGERGNNRLVIVEGPSGSGKTTAARCLAARFGRRLVMTEADETWKESLNAMLGGLLRGLRVREIPPSADARKTKLLELLRDTPVCVVIDEAHHLGPRTLNLVKTIINQSPSQIVFLCIPTLFKKLECAAYEEAKQLTKNRLCERVKFTEPGLADVEKFLAKRLKFEDGSLKPCARLAAERSLAHGHWNYINIVSRKCRQLAGKSAVDNDTFAKALDQASQSR